MTFKADLHCHSTCSDGSLTPQQLVDLAIERNLQGLSITDHDTVAAYPAIMEYAKKRNLQMAIGVEFSAHHQEKSVHILGYRFDTCHPSISTLCDRHQERRKERNGAILKKLSEEGMDISEDELYSIPSETIGRPHIAEWMVKKGYVPDIQRAFKRFLGDGKKCFAQGPTISVEETLDALHQAGGIAVLAHPHLFSNKKFVRRLLELPFDGIECDYARMPLELNMPWHTLANERQLIRTAGSDFHGDKKPAIPLGASTVGIETFQLLQ